MFERELERPLEPCLRLLAAPGAQRHLAGALEQPRALEVVIHERRRLLEIMLGFLTRGERRRPLARAREEVAGALLDLVRVAVLWFGFVRGEVMGGEHLDHLLLCDERPLEMRGGSEMTSLALAFRECLVGDPPDEIL